MDKEETKQAYNNSSRCTADLIGIKSACATTNINQGRSYAYTAKY